MKIIYAENPLRTVIELDEHEKKELWYKIKLEQYEEMIFSAHHTLTNNEWYNAAIKPRSLEEAVAEASRELDPKYWCTDEKSKLDERVDEMFNYYIEDLRGTHVGDCTCVACSCTKCHAESLLGIDTIKGLGKHPGHHIASAFSYKEGDEWKERSIDQALDILKNYKPGATWVGWEPHADRWTRESKDAYEWLSNYKEKYLDKPVASF